MKRGGSYNLFCHCKNWGKCSSSRDYKHQAESTVIFELFVSVRQRGSGYGLETMPSRRPAVKEANPRPFVCLHCSRCHEQSYRSVMNEQDILCHTLKKQGTLKWKVQVWFLPPRICLLPGGAPLLLRFPPTRICVHHGVAPLILKFLPP